MAHGTFPNIAFADEARSRPDVLCWRKPYVLPRHLLLAEGRPVAGMEVLCIGGHEPYEQHLARCPVPHEVHRALSELPAVGKARQRLPGLSARARPMEEEP